MPLDDSSTDRAENLHKRVGVLLELVGELRWQLQDEKDNSSGLSRQLEDAKKEIADLRATCLGRKEFFR